MHITRRQFLTTSLTLSSLAAVGVYNWPRPPKISGAIIGANSQVGHLLRDGKLTQQPPTRTIQREITIVGGGIAGLSAAYTLHKAGKTDFTLLELESHTGGNSSSGQNEVSAYPWGAHYVPLLSKEATVARALFEDFGVIKGYQDGLPIYEELYLCADPHERLFMRGHWQEDLLPTTGISNEVEKQYRQFFSLIDQYKTLHGSDGKKVFAIPVDASSQEPQWLALDQISMATWMQQQGLLAEELAWYVDYCCRDDYGTTYQDTSAWAGIHYFAARNGKAANASPGTVLTWPQGNGWLAQQLAKPVQDHLQTQAVVYQIEPHAKGVNINYWDSQRNETVQLQSRAVILAVPRFVATRMLPSISAQGFSYAPWAVANITLDRLPATQNGLPLAWDNVAYRSKMLGYVTATHQITQMRPTQTVLTYYWPLSHLPPDVARKQALARSYQQWQDEFLEELLRLHPDLKGHIRHLDICVWGHAMIRPVPGFIWGEQRRQALLQHPPVFTAHSDQSGISIFEEACEHGVNAARGVMKWLG